jgi:transposase InsO family protein
MDVVLSGLNFVMCLVYLDDIIIFSQTVEEHLERLELLFQRLRTANLKLKPSKCYFMKHEIEFLGHVVSAEGVSTDPAKVADVVNWKVPTCVGEVRSFVGLCSYYRRYVRNFAEVAAPLHRLTGKKVPFEWSEKCQTAFDTLKTLLTTAPILAMPNDEGRYILDTDASDIAVGAVLSQVQHGGDERVIAYASRTLDGPELNYCATRRELLAVVYFLKYFRTYLLGPREFLVRTDHSALQWLRRMPDPIGQNARWLESMEEYLPFTIQHRPGLKHGNADALSRRPCPQCENGTLESGPAETADTGVWCRATQLPDRWSKVELAAATSQDGELSEFVSLLAQYGSSIGWEQVVGASRLTKAYWAQRERLILSEGVLYREWTSSDGLQKRLQLVPPEVVRGELMSMSHGGSTGGHLGYRRTKAQVGRRAYWIGWSTDVERFCRACNACAKYHRGTLKRRGELQPTKVGEPLERMAIDLTGPHPPSRGGHVYILTAIDLFTKWAAAVPLRNKEAATVARGLVREVFNHIGTPIQLLSDQGKEFGAELMLTLCKVLRVDKIRTSAYHPSTNGCIERFHRTLNSMLGKVVEDHQRDWAERLPEVMVAYNASPQEATQFTPNFLMYGREFRAAVDLLFEPPDAEVEYRTYPEFVTQQLQRQRAAYKLVRQHLGVAAERMKDRYDARVRSDSFTVGQWVWYYSPRRYRGRSPKWQRCYSGPYLVVAKRDQINYVIQLRKRSDAFTVHVDKLKAVLGDTPESWLKQQPGCEAPGPQLVQAGEPLGSQGDTEVRPEETDEAELHLAGFDELPVEYPHVEEVEGLSTLDSPPAVPTRGPSRSRRQPSRFDDFVMSKVLVGQDPVYSPLTLEGWTGVDEL